MEPNNTNSSNTPPTGDTPPVQPPVAEDQTAPNETPEQVTEAPVAPTETPAPEPVDPVAPATPDASVGATPVPDQTAPVQAAATEPTPAPVSAFGGAPGTPEAPKQLDKKKIITIAAIAGGVLLLAIAGIVAYTLFNSVSKEDYKAAVQQFNEVSSASSSLSSDVSGLSALTNSSSEEAFEEGIAEVDASIAKLKTENAELAKLKAVRVGEGADLYKTFNDKLTTYLGYGEGLVTSVKNLRPAFVTCRSTNEATDNAARATALEECATALEEVKTIPNAEMKAYVAAITKGYKEYASLYGQVAELTNPFGSQYEQYKTLRDQVYEVQDEISAASKTFSEDIEKKGDEVSVKESANALGDYLSEQQR